MKLGFFPTLIATVFTQLTGTRSTKGMETCGFMVANK